MINNDQRDVLNFGNSMGCYRRLALVYLEVEVYMTGLARVF